jgi:hypothetical protein
MGGAKIVLKDAKDGSLDSEVRNTLFTLPPPGP